MQERFFQPVTLRASGKTSFLSTYNLSGREINQYHRHKTYVTYFCRRTKNESQS